MRTRNFTTIETVFSLRSTHSECCVLKERRVHKDSSCAHQVSSCWGFLGLTAFCILSLFLAGCGRFGPPLPPESFAPAAVQELQVQPSVDGMKFTWRTPKEDRRGMELENLSYFEVRRAQTEDLVSFLKDPLRASEVVGRMYDPTQKLIQEERRVARAEKKPARKIKASESLVTHEFLDEAVEPNGVYIYSIVPFSEDGVAGEVAQYVRVVFSGLTSKVEMLDVTALNRPYILDF